MSKQKQNNLNLPLKRKLKELDDLDITVQEYKKIRSFIQETRKQQEKPENNTKKPRRHASGVKLGGFAGTRTPNLAIMSRSL